MRKFSETDPITGDSIALDDPFFVLNKSQTSGPQSGPGGTVRSVTKQQLLGRGSQVIRLFLPEDATQIGLLSRVASHIDDIPTTADTVITRDTYFWVQLFIDGVVTDVYFQNIKGFGSYGTTGDLQFAQTFFNPIGLIQHFPISTTIFVDNDPNNTPNSLTEVVNILNASDDIPITTFGNQIFYVVNGVPTVYEYTGGNTIIGSGQTPIAEGDLTVVDGIVFDATPQDFQTSADQVPVDGTPEYHPLPQGDETVFGWLTGNDKSWGWLLQQYGIEGTFGGYYETINGAGTNLFNSQGSQVSDSLYLVRDASFDANVTTGFGLYKYLGTTIGDITDYELQLPIKTKLSEFTDDIGATLVRTRNTVYVNPLVGNDTTALVNAPDSPYATYGAAYDAIPTTNELWTIELVGDTDFSITRAFNKRVLLTTQESTKIDLSPLTGNFINQNIYIEAPFAEIFINKIASNKLRFQGIDIFINVRSINATVFPDNGTGNRGYLFDLNINSIINARDITFKTLGDVSLTNFVYSSTLSVVNFTTESARVLSNAVNVTSISTLTLTRSLSYSYSSSAPIPRAIRGTGGINLNRPVLDITGLSTDPTVNVSFAGVRTITGIMGSGFQGKLLFSKGTSGFKYTFDRFNGYVQHLNFIVDDIIISIIDSKIRTDDVFIETTSSFANYTGKLILDNAEIEMSTPAPLIQLFGAGTPDIEVIKSGFLRTNATAIGDGFITDKTFNLEGTKQIVVFDKSQIVNKVLSTDLIYEINADLELGAGDYIWVPSGGNLTINGYGLEVSIIRKNVAGESIFASEAGGSGGLLIDGLKLVMGTPTTSCFALTDATGFNAVELVKVNFEGSGNIGYLDGYRQSLWANIGVFGLSDGLEFRNNWVGGFRSETVIVRNLSGTGTLFKAGAGLVFNSRFFSNANIDLPSGWAISDMEPDNFAKDNLFQLKGMIVTREGVIDATDTGYFPNINETEDESIWRDNVGVRNTYIGGLWEITTEAVTTINTAGTYERISGTTTYSDLQHFSNGGGFNNVLTSTGSLTKDVSVRIQGVIDGVANTEVSLRLRIFDRSASTYVDYSPVTQTINNSLGGDDVTNFSYEWRVFDLADDDRVEIWATTANGTNITAKNGFQLFVNERR